MLKKFYLVTAISMSFFNAFTQDTTKTFVTSGSIDGYYRYNFSGEQNNYTSFINSQSSFELGMATLRLDATAKSGKVGATIDLGFGRRAEEFSYNDGDADADKNGFITLAAIKQAFITYIISSKVKFTAGKFATHVGYEVVDAPLNRNYSMSYMFTNGPFLHTGLKGEVSTGLFAFMLGITNYADQSTSSTAVKNLIAQISAGTKNGKLKVFLNYSGFAGSDSGKNPSSMKSLHQIDLVLNGIISNKFGIGCNSTIQYRKPTTLSNGKWIGNAIYLNFDPTGTVGITLRSEYIIDKKTIYFATKNIFANTLSLNYRIGPLTIIPEFRFENSNSNFYFKKDGSGTKSTAAALLAAVYKF